MICTAQIRWATSLLFHSKFFDSEAQGKDFRYVFKVLINATSGSKQTGKDSYPEQYKRNTKCVTQTDLGSNDEGHAGNHLVAGDFLTASLTR